MGESITLLHHPTGEQTTSSPDWVVLAVPQRPVEWLYHELVNDGVSVERVGDCIAPRRAHAAVVEGDRAGSSVCQNSTLVGCDRVSQNTDV